MADLAIDLGTGNTLVFVKGKGIVFNEPTAIAYDDSNSTVIAFGSAAAEMIGRTPPSIRVVRPLETGVIADFEAAHTFITSVLKKVVRVNRFRPMRVVIGVPSRVSSVEFKTFQDALSSSHISKIYAVQEPVAAAIGSGLDFSRPKGCMIIDIGAGTTDLALLSLGRVVSSRSLRAGADAIASSLAIYLKNSHRINVGQRTAENFLREHGQASIIDDKPGFISGLDVVTGLPIQLEITAEEIHAAIKEQVFLIMSELRYMLDGMPPELASDILTEGIHLTGGGSLLRGLPELITQQTGLTCKHVPDPIQAVVLGCGAILDDFKLYRFLLETQLEKT